MKYLQVTTLLLALVYCSDTSAENSAQVEAGRLLDLMQVQKTLDATVPMMLDIMLKQNPKIVPLKGVLLDFLSKHMSYEALKPGYIEIYTTEFTAKELADMVAFYSTETGQKYINKIPKIISESSLLGQKSVEDNMPELEKMLSDELVRIQLEQEAAK